MPRPGKQLSFHRTVEMHHAQQFVVIHEITRLRFHIFGQPLGDPQGIGQFQVKFIIFDFFDGRENFPGAGGLDQTCDSFIHDIRSFRLFRMVSI